VRKNWFLYEVRKLKTTWKLRIGVILALILFALLTGNYWLVAIGHSLVHEDELVRSDVILIEDFELGDYLLYEAAAGLQDRELGTRVLVTGWTRSNRTSPDPWVRQVIQTISSAAGVEGPEIIGMRELEPITLNVARQLGDALRKDNVRSVIVVSNAFRSNRSSRVYRKVLEPLGIQVYIAPVFGTRKPKNWWRTWHGIQEVIQEFLKLQYYRFFVLPKQLPEQT